jgi:hypothetical protein
MIFPINHFIARLRKSDPLGKSIKIIIFVLLNNSATDERYPDG